MVSGLVTHSYFTTPTSKNARYDINISRLGASRSQDLNLLLDIQLKSFETRHQSKLKEVAKLTAAVDGWKIAAQRCNAVHNDHDDLAESRRKALQDEGTFE